MPTSPILHMSKLKQRDGGAAGKQEVKLRKEPEQPGSKAQTPGHLHVALTAETEKQGPEATAPGSGVWTLGLGRKGKPEVGRKPEPV